MGDWMGSFVHVKLTDRMGHIGQMTEMTHSLSQFNLEVLVFYFYFIFQHMSKKVYRITF